MREKPQLIIGSTPCMVCSSLQHMDEPTWRGSRGKDTCMRTVCSEVVMHVQFYRGNRSRTDCNSFMHIHSMPGR